ncbi:hypothetical protein LC605_29900 [Nostoc sp. CHAB 5836]|nr:hypothetical protein [Nostoc sp. CHAB 5836]
MKFLTALPVTDSTRVSYRLKGEWGMGHWAWLFSLSPCPPTPLKQLSVISYQSWRRMVGDKEAPPTLDTCRWGT